MAKIKGGRTLSVKLADGIDVKPGDLLISTGSEYGAFSSDVTETNIAKVAISLDYDSSGNGIIGVVPMYSGCRISEIGTDLLTGVIALGDPVAVIAGKFKKAVATNFVIGYATGSNSVTTEGAGYIKA